MHKLVNWEDQYRSQTFTVLFSMSKTAFESFLDLFGLVVGVVG